MSTVPTPINAELVNAAIIALTAFCPEDREQATALLFSWKHRDKLLASDAAVVLDRLFPADTDRYAEGYLDAMDFVKRMRDEQRQAGKAAPVEQPACPAWCTLTHDPEDDARDDLALHMDDDHTDGTVRKLIDAHALEVRVARLDVLSEGRLGTPNLFVRVDAELTTWEQAAELARLILDGFGYLKDA